MIFKRALQATDPIRVVFGLPQAAEFVIGGHPASTHVVTSSGCGIYDITAGVAGAVVWPAWAGAEHAGQGLMPVPGRTGAAAAAGPGSRPRRRINLAFNQ